MEDMRAAGLNPILAYQTGVPGTAGGSAASRGSTSVGQAITAGARAPAEVAKAGSAKALLQAQIATEKERKKLTIQQGIHAAQSAQNLTYDAVQKRSRIPEAAAIREIDSSSLGQKAIKTRRVLTGGASAVTSAAGAAKALIK